jgi:hypothetical protein
MRKLVVPLLVFSLMLVSSICFSSLVEAQTMPEIETASSSKSINVGHFHHKRRRDHCRRGRAPTPSIARQCPSSGPGRSPLAVCFGVRKNLPGLDFPSLFSAFS